jgi:hypothetical protein
MLTFPGVGSTGVGCTLSFLPLHTLLHTFFGGSGGSTSEGGGVVRRSTKGHAGRLSRVVVLPDATALSVTTSQRVEDANFSASSAASLAVSQHAPSMALAVKRLKTPMSANSFCLLSGSVPRCSSAFLFFERIRARLTQQASVGLR